MRSMEKMGIASTPDRQAPPVEGALGRFRRLGSSLLRAACREPGGMSWNVRSGSGATSLEGPQLSLDEFYEALDEIDNVYRDQSPDMHAPRI